MGFNTWTAFGPDIDEQLVFQTAGFLNNLTLSKLGYNLIVLDGALLSPARAKRRSRCCELALLDDQLRKSMLLHMPDRHT